jgi:acyl carrier protein
MDTFETIHRLAAELLKLPAQLLAQTTTLEEAGLDSLTSVDLVLAIEAQFSVSIPAADLDPVRSLHDLAVIVDRLMSRQTQRHDELP